MVELALSNRLVTPLLGYKYKNILNKEKPQQSSPCNKLH